MDEFYGDGSGYLPAPFEEGLQLVLDALATAAGGQESWLARIRVGVPALLACLDAEAQWARVLVLEAPVGAATTVQCVRQVQVALAPVLVQAREEIIIGAEVRPPAGLIAELLTLAVLSVIRAAMLKGDGEPLVGLAPSLLRHVVEPYLGRGAQRADRAGQSGAGAAAAERAEMVPIRPHQRTIQALQVIALTPRLSGREVGRAVGIENNSGHISTLLYRLQQRGLIENAGSRESKHQPQAWLLTPYGHRILQILGHSHVAHTRGAA